jgi:hypothetical protein
LKFGLKLVRKEMLSIQADPRSPEHGQYTFLQDLVRRVAYDTISKRERKPKHLAAADFLLSLSSAEENETVEVVASHSSTPTWRRRTIRTPRRSARKPRDARPSGGPGAVSGGDGGGTACIRTRNRG